MEHSPHLLCRGNTHTRAMKAATEIKQNYHRAGLHLLQMVSNFSFFSNMIFIKGCYSDEHGAFLIISWSGMFPHFYTEKDGKKMSIRTSLSLKIVVSVTLLLLAATAILAACGSSSSGTATASSSSSTSSSATAGHPGSGGSNAR